MNCNTCESATYAKEIFGCEKPLTVPATWLGDEDEWYSCPYKFITEGIKEFLDMYDSYKSNEANPPIFGGYTARYLEAKKTLEYYISKYTQIKTGQ